MQFIIEDDILRVGWLGQKFLPGQPAPAKRQMQVAAAIGQFLARQRDRPVTDNPEAIVQVQMPGKRRDLGDLGHQVHAFQVAL